MPTNKPISSRLAKKQQRKLAQQTALIIFLILALILGFLFLILPNIVRVAFNVLDGDVITNSSDDIPPQIPILDAPVEATYSGTIKLTGFGEAKSKIVLVLNGNESDEQTISDEGTFELSADLTEGENSLTTYAIDEAKNESLTSRKYAVTLDTETPTIEIEEPENESRITLRKNQITTVKGLTEPNAKVYIGGRLSFANSDGNFAGTYSLTEGDNKIPVRAVDKAGNELELELTINFAY
jgi:large repetitive protein